MDIALHMGALAQGDVSAAYGAIHAPVQDGVFGHHLANDLPIITNDERNAVDITLDFTLDQHLTLREKVPDYFDVLTNNGRSITAQCSC